MTDRCIRAYVKKGASIMRLSHWSITVKILDCVNSSVGSSVGEAYGVIDWFTDEHTATIYLRRGMSNLNTKATIRHELLHLRLEGHKVCQQDCPMYEFAINIIANAWKL